MEQETGGPAFPCETPNEVFSGMDLRDYFAAKVLSSIDEDIHGVLYNIREDYDADKQAQVIARTAYILADAMLAERKKSNQLGDSK